MTACKEACDAAGDARSGMEGGGCRKGARGCVEDVCGKKAGRLLGGWCMTGGSDRMREDERGEKASKLDGRWWMAGGSKRMRGGCVRRESRQAWAQVCHRCPQ